MACSVARDASTAILGEDVYHSHLHNFLVIMKGRGRGDDGYS